MWSRLQARLWALLAGWLEAGSLEAPVPENNFVTLTALAGAAAALVARLAKEARRLRRRE